MPEVKKTLELAKWPKEAYQELKKTTWPTQQQVKQSTLAVILAIAVVGCWIAGLDAVLSMITGPLFK